MAQRNPVDKRDRDTESKFYLPVGFTPPFEASQFERIWTTLFNHDVESPK